MFILSNDAIDWFNIVIKNRPYTQSASLDVYHMCFTVCANKVLKDNDLHFEEDQNPHKEAFIPLWAEAYKEHSLSIIALMLEAEITRLDYDKNDKEAIRSFVRDNLDVDSPTRLSKVGGKLMDLYSYNGFLFLQKKMREKPEDPILLLREYGDILSGILKN